MFPLNRMYRKQWRVILLPLIILLLFFMIRLNTVDCAISDVSALKKIESICPSLQILKEKIKYSHSFYEACLVIIDMFGKPNRNIGSGLSIPQWNIDGGFLTCHPFFGVSFSKNNYDIGDWDDIYFINTENMAEENIMAKYMMIALESDVDATQYYYGYLDLEKNGKYNFRDEIDKEERTRQRKNFFHNNPKGTFLVEYLNNISPDSLLETIENGTMLAKIKFKSGNQSEILYFSIKGRLIQSNEAATFRLEKSWKYFFYIKPIQSGNNLFGLFGG